MNAGREIVAYGENPSCCMRRTRRRCDGRRGGIILRFGPAARVGTTAADVRAPRTRAGREGGNTPALRAARAPGEAPDGREHGPRDRPSGHVA